MSLNSLGLGFMFTATDLASGVMDRVKNNLESLSDASGRAIEGMDSKLKAFGTGIAAMAIGFGGLSAGFSMANKYGEFEQAIAAVGAVSGASADELKLLKKAAMDAGIATQFSPTEATLGLNELAQAGYSATEQVDLLRPALDLAAGSLGQLSPQDAAGLAAQAMKAFGIETNLAGVAVDQMLQAANMFAMRADDLPLALGIASRGAQTLNQSLTETVISVGLVKNVIPGTERAATSVAVAMEKLANPKVQKALHKIGVAAVDATGNFRPFLDILGDMIPALDKMSLAERAAFLQKTFGAESLGGLNAIMSQVTTGIKTNTGETVKGAAALEYLRHGFTTASGVAKEFADKLLDTFEGQKKLLAGSVETLAIQLGEPFAKALRPAVELAIAAVNKFLDVFGKLPEPLKIGIVLTAMMSFAMIGLAGAIITLKAAWPLLVLGTKLATASLGELAVAAWAVVAPFAPFVLGALAIAGVIYAVRNNVFGLGDAWDYWVGVLNNKTLKTVGKWLLLILGPIAGGYGITMGLITVIPMLTTGIGGLTTAFQLMGAAMLANPFGLIIAGLALIVLGILAVKNNWLGLGDAWGTGALIIGEFFDTFDKHWQDWKKNVLVGIDDILDAFRKMITFFDQIGFDPGGMVSAAKVIMAGIPTSLVGPDVQGERALRHAPPPALMSEQPAEALFSLPDQATSGTSMNSIAAAARSAPPMAPTTMPSLAEAMSSEEPRSSSDPMTFDYEKMAAAMSKRPLTTIVEIDGERIASATSNVQRENMSRSGVPMSSSE